MFTFAMYEVIRFEAKAKIARLGKFRYLKGNTYLYIGVAANDYAAAV